ncbi:metal ABC transporter substrate-binding protein [Paenibacillus sp. YYML68]|uniref:metal ABC transporter substrate-binding protein n=1 Tax=Paenibacillus sp. YYML68 TaxID=2909250 RepID=UPI002490D2F8|nr:metal ABC transporter substrate-binding protein [Paenibacillus sp. YYML68]
MLRTGLKKTLLACSLVALLLSSMTACGKEQPQLASDKINIVASFYPLYDFAQAVGGSRVHVINMVPAGVEPHDWSPKSRDIQTLTKADLFLYLGAGFEGWVGDTLGSLKSDVKVKPVEASHGIELIPGTEDEHGHEDESKDAHGHKDEHKDSHGHKDEHKSKEDEHDHGSMDPHVWLSPLKAKQMALNIKDALVEVDGAGKAEYEANYKQLEGKLDALHEKYKTELAKTKKKEIVVTHQSFGYLAHEYGLTQMAIMGLAPDAEPTSREMKNILAFIREHEVKYIFFEELISDKLAKTLAGDAGVETLVLSPLEGITEEQLRNGDNYITIMESNLNNLLKALQ